ncbi:hypothetical protein GUITHDRAFT_99624 [Guillardia theta CCMP2712]|uniref:Uncharacterized protein n=1 Tax=Guillardia theta (strain CCMP2712) TaxID=905079 RepID=L1K3N9_GUITC|nr:hypothetical protein GUITHDRAFT_99624 [Guillardia theta CCMP2712]EKX54978.1 hypothetical protein GUITHDRAFT_99624 [Guillardia theta CCMP2712]|eukprot:XP_005841958.1 hypothetical protein GUITHDRAFT_99624 [Guillardia theta CCMP2712]
MGGNLLVQEIVYVYSVVSIYQVNFVGFQAQSEDYPLVYSLYQSINSSANGLLYVDSGIDSNFQIYHSETILGAVSISGFVSSVQGESVGYQHVIGSSHDKTIDVSQSLAQLQAAYGVLSSLMQEVSRTANSKALKQIAFISLQAGEKYSQLKNARGGPESSLQLDALDSPKMSSALKRSISESGSSLSPDLLAELQGVSEDVTDVFAEAILSMFSWQSFGIGLTDAISRLVNLLKRVEDSSSSHDHPISQVLSRRDQDFHLTQLSASSASQPSSELTILAADALLQSWNYSTLSNDDVGSFSLLYGKILTSLMGSTDETLKLSIANSFLTACKHFVLMVDSEVPWWVYTSFVDDVGKLCVIVQQSSSLSSVMLQILDYSNQIIRGSLKMIVDGEESRLIETSFASVWTKKVLANELFSQHSRLCMLSNGCIQTALNEAFLPEPAMDVTSAGTLSIQIILWKTLPNAFTAVSTKAIALGPILQLNATTSRLELNYMSHYRKLRDAWSVTFDIQSLTSVPRCAWISDMATLDTVGLVADCATAGKLTCWSYARGSRLAVIYVGLSTNSGNQQYRNIRTASFQGAYSQQSEVASTISLLIVITTSVISFVHFLRVAMFVRKVLNRYLGFKTTEFRKPGDTLTSSVNESVENSFSLRRLFLHHPVTTLLFFAFQPFPVYLHRISVLSASINFLLAMNFTMQAMRVFVESDWAAQATVMSILVVPVYLLLLFPIFAQQEFEHVMFRKKGRVVPEDVPDSREAEASATEAQTARKSGRHHRRSRKAKGRRSRRIDEELESAMDVTSQTSDIMSTMSSQSPQGPTRGSHDDSQRHPFSPSTLRVSMVNWSVSSPKTSSLVSTGSKRMSSSISRTGREGLGKKSQAFETEIEEEEEDLEGIAFRVHESGTTFPVVGQHFGLPYEEIVLPPAPPSTPRLHDAQHQDHDGNDQELFTQNLLSRLEYLTSSPQSAARGSRIPEDMWHAGSPVQSDVTLPHQLSFAEREERPTAQDTSQAIPLDISELQTGIPVTHQESKGETASRALTWTSVMFVAARWVLLNPLLFFLAAVDASGAFVLRTSPSVNVILFNVLLWYLVDQLSFSFDPSYNHAWEKAIALSIVLWVILHAVLLIGVWAMRARIMRS